MQSCGVQLHTTPNSEIYVSAVRNTQTYFSNTCTFLRLLSCLYLIKITFVFMWENKNAEKVLNWYKTPHIEFIETVLGRANINVANRSRRNIQNCNCHKVYSGRFDWSKWWCGGHEICPKSVADLKNACQTEIRLDTGWVIKMIIYFEA